MEASTRASSTAIWARLRRRRDLILLVLAPVSWSGTGPPGRPSTGATGITPVIASWRLRWPTTWPLRRPGVSDQAIDWQQVGSIAPPPRGAEKFLKNRLDRSSRLGYIGRYLSEFLPTYLRIEFLLRTQGVSPCPTRSLKFE